MQSAPVGITRLGEQIVVWRNKDGELQALEDRGLRWRTEPLADGGAWVAILRPAA